MTDELMTEKQMIASYMEDVRSVGINIRKSIYIDPPAMQIAKLQDIWKYFFQNMTEKQMIASYIEDIQNAGVAPPEGVFIDPPAMQIAKLQNVWKGIGYA